MKTYQINVDQTEWMNAHNNAYVYFTNKKTLKSLTFKKSLFSLFETQDREFVWQMMDKSLFTLDELLRLKKLNDFMVNKAKAIKIYMYQK